MCDRKKQIVKSNIFLLYNIEHVIYTQEEFGRDAWDIQKYLTHCIKFRKAWAWN